MDVLDLGAAPAVDGLVVVADDGGGVVVVGEQPQPGVLNGVGVLKLVHQNVPEAALIVPAQLVVVAEQLQHTQQHLVEVHQAAPGAGFLVGQIDFLHGLQKQVAAGHVHMRGAQALVLLAVDEPGGLARRPALFVQPQLADHPLDQTLLIVGVDDLEVLRQARFLPVLAQQAVGDAVEGAHPHAAGGHVEQLLDAAAHFRRRLVGECHGENTERRRLFGGDLPGDTVHQHPGLARAGTGQHQQVPVFGGHRVALSRVKAFNKGSHIIHGGGVYQNRRFGAAGCDAAPVIRFPFAVGLGKLPKKKPGVTYAYGFPSHTRERLTHRRPRLRAWNLYPCRQHSSHNQASSSRP